MNPSGSGIFAARSLPSSARTQTSGSPPLGSGEGAPRSGWIAAAFLSAFILPVSFVPSSRGLVFEIPALPTMWWTDNLLLLFALSVVPIRWLGGASRMPKRTTRRWFVWPLLLLGMWQVVSLAWNGRDATMRHYSFVQSLCMCAAVCSGVWLASGLPHATRLQLARGTTLLIAFVIAVYMGLSFVFPSWRPSAEWRDLTTPSLGFIRVYGPLGTATTLNFLLLPVLGFCVGMSFVPSLGRLIWMGLAVFFILAILATGSRGGVLGLSTFAVLIAAAIRVRAVLFLVPAGFFLAVLVALTGVPERFRDFEDRARFETYETAVRAFLDNPRNIVIGTGHGSLYSKLHDDSFRMMWQRNQFYLAEDQTPFGHTLRNSHSALLRTLTETGVIGSIMLATPLSWMMWRLLAPSFYRARDRRNILGKAILAGAVAMIPYMALEEFFISAFWIVLLWTMYVVIGVEGIEESVSPP